MTSQLQKLLIELEALKTKSALDAVQNPGPLTGENYGVAVGVQRGLDLAVKKIRESIAREEGKL